MLRVNAARNGLAKHVQPPAVQVVAIVWAEGFVCPGLASAALNSTESAANM
jgi:hypothetical protein